MLIKSLIYLLASVLVVFFPAYLSWVMIKINGFYLYLCHQLEPFTFVIGFGPILTQVLVLLLLPLLIAIIPAGLYRFQKGKDWPYFFDLVWFLWVLLVLNKVLIH